MDMEMDVKFHIYGNPGRHIVRGLHKKSLLWSFRHVPVLCPDE